MTSNKTATPANGAGAGAVLAELAARAPAAETMTGYAAHRCTLAAADAAADLPGRVLLADIRAELYRLEGGTPTDPAELLAATRVAVRAAAAGKVWTAQQTAADLINGADVGSLRAAEGRAINARMAARSNSAYDSAEAARVRARSARVMSSLATMCQTR